MTERADLFTEENMTAVYFFPEEYLAGTVYQIFLDIEEDSVDESVSLESPPLSSLKSSIRDVSYGSDKAGSSLPSIVAGTGEVAPRLLFHRRPLVRHNKAYGYHIMSLLKQISYKMACATTRSTKGGNKTVAKGRLGGRRSGRGEGRRHGAMRI